MDARSLLAGVLGVALGLVLVAAPGVVIRAHAAGRVPPGRRGEYGTDGDADTRWRRAVQLVGVALVLAGLYFGTVAVASL